MKTLHTLYHAIACDLSHFLCHHIMAWPLTHVNLTRCRNILHNIRIIAGPALGVLLLAASLYGLWHLWLFISA